MSECQCFKSKPVRLTLLSLLVLAVLGGAFFVYTNQAFPRTRCEAFKHLENKADQQIDCYGCHQKVSPKSAQNWYESKHGMDLVKCALCHGSPDNKGAIPFSAKPSPDIVCVRCHDPAMKTMRDKFGVRADCYGCHPFHQNSLHHATYGKSESKTKIEEEAKK